MEVTIAIITACGASLVALLSNLIQIRASNKKKICEMDQALIDGMRELLYYRIKHNAEKCLKDGYITIDGFHDIHRMYNIYHDKLGGNGFITGLMADLEELPKK